MIFELPKRSSRKNIRMATLFTALLVLYQGTFLEGGRKRKITICAG